MYLNWWFRRKKYWYYKCKIQILHPSFYSKMQSMYHLPIFTDKPFCNEKSIMNLFYNMYSMLPRKYNDYEQLIFLDIVSASVKISFDFVSLKLMKSWFIDHPFRDFFKNNWLTHYFYFSRCLVLSGINIGWKQENIIGPPSPFHKTWVN